MPRGFSKRCECGTKLGPFELEPGENILRCPKCSKRTSVPESSDPNAFDIPSLLVEVKRLRKDNDSLVEENFKLTELVRQLRDQGSELPPASFGLGHIS